MKQESPAVIPGAPVANNAFIQLLDASGAQVCDEQFSPWLADLQAEDFQAMYRDMKLTRYVDEEATALQRQGELALWVPSFGQEATQAGVVHASENKDYIFPTYREHLIALARGVRTRDIFKLFRGISHGGWDPAESNFHPYTLVLAAQVTHAVGYAMGVQRDYAASATGEQEAVIAFFGDGASSEGDIHESMVFASSYQAPVVFICQNNHWAISVPAEVQSKFPLVNRAAGYGIPGIRVDGNDVLACYAVSRWALQHARSGLGPVLIEAVTYRMGAHTTADDPTKYRTSVEEEEWQERDPVMRFEQFLRHEGYADQAFFDDVDREGKEYAQQLRADLPTAEGAELDAVFEQIYAQEHPLVAEEQRWLRDYNAGFEAETSSEQGVANS